MKKKFFIIFVFTLIFLPKTSFSGFFGFLNPLESIENKILSGEYGKAEKEINSIPIKSKTEKHYEAIKIINFLKASERFDFLIRQSVDPFKIKKFFLSNVEEEYNRLPKKIKLSKTIFEKIKSTIKLNSQNIVILNKLIEEKNAKIKKERELAIKKEKEEYAKKRKEYNEKIKKEKIEKEKQEAKSREKQLVAEKARQKQLLKYEEQTRIVREKIAEKIRAAKEKCGDDYQKIRAGMKFSRVQECVGGFELVGQLPDPAGLVSIYQRGSGIVKVQNGVVVAWLK